MYRTTQNLWLVWNNFPVSTRFKRTVAANPAGLDLFGISVAVSAVGTPFHGIDRRNRGGLEDWVYLGDWDVFCQCRGDILGGWYPGWIRWHTVVVWFCTGANWSVFQRVHSRELFNLSVQVDTSRCISLTYELVV